MTDDLAKRLLARVMGWDAPKLTEERPILRALATLKYDSYQQFAPGMRYIASLATWLAQFEPSDRSIAYEFVKNKLIFMSSAEIEHLVQVAFPDHIRPLLMGLAASNAHVPTYHISNIEGSADYRKLLRETLYLGLSDGARIDSFRRSGALDIDHEQVFVNYDLGSEKCKKLHSKLASALGLESADCSYKVIVLIDDFSASGISCIREETGGFGGKVEKVLHSMFDASGAMLTAKLVDPDNARIFILLYIATEAAKQHIERLTRKYLEDIGRSADLCKVIVLQTIPESVVVSHTNDSAFVRLLEQYFDNSVIDEHYEKGVHARPYLGFNEGGLPLVLVHNTPNNSVPLLWLEAGGIRCIQGLFPRISRHKSERVTD